jgi:hypothetical protein
MTRTLSVALASAALLPVQAYAQVHDQAHDHANMNHAAAPEPVM